MGELVGKRGVLATLCILWAGRDVTRANREISQAQKDGPYWMHSHRGFCDAAENAGLEIVESREVYREYSDLVIARRRRQG